MEDVTETERTTERDRAKEHEFLEEKSLHKRHLIVAAHTMSMVYFDFVLKGADIMQINSETHHPILTSRLFSRGTDSMKASYILLFFALFFTMSLRNVARSWSRHKEREREGEGEGEIEIEREGEREGERDRDRERARERHR